MPMTEAPVNANPVPLAFGIALAPTPPTWILIDDVRPEVVPVAVIVWAPERLTPRTRTSLKEPLALATTEGKWVPLSNLMVTVSPGVKPEPLIVMLDPAAGAWLLTETVGGVTYAALAGPAKATTAMIMANITMRGMLSRLLVGMKPPL